jgi:hypothetical protein
VAFRRVETFAGDATAGLEVLPPNRPLAKRLTFESGRRKSRQERRPAPGHLPLQSSCEKKIIAANWKMNLTHREVLPYLEALLAQVGGVVDQVDVVLIPPFTALPVLAEALTKVPGVQFGAQNMHWAQSGAYTGEISPAMLQAWGVRYVVLGHSERRALFGETDEGVNRKTLSALNAGLNPILCVGESLEERGRTLASRRHRWGAGRRRLLRPPRFRADRS